MKKDENLYIGIDPGKTGAIAAIGSSGKLIGVNDFTDTGLFDILAGVGGQIERQGVGAPVPILPTATAYLELVHSMPGQGVSSTFSFGENYGWWKGYLLARGIPTTLITPQRWQKGLLPNKESKKDKPALRMARRLFGELSDLRLAKHHNRADAIMIALRNWIDNSGRPSVEQMKRRIAEECLAMEKEKIEAL